MNKNNGTNSIGNWSTVEQERELEQEQEQELEQEQEQERLSFYTLFIDMKSTKHSTAIINGSFDMYQRPRHWMEKMFITRVIFNAYHKIRNWTTINI